MIFYNNQIVLCFSRGSDLSPGGKAHVMQYLIGIDAGTTNQKAILFDETGRTVAQSIRPSPLTAGADGTAVYDADAVWTQICAMLREITAQAEPEVVRRIAGIAVTGMAEAGVPLSAEGAPLYPFIAWYDPRTIPYQAWWEANCSRERITQITGLKMQHIFSVNKLMWLRDHHPDVFRRTSQWGCMEDFIAFRLSGVLKMDYSIASRTMMMDLAARQWSQEILDTAGLPRRILPELVPSGQRIGTVHAAAAKQTGLLSGTPVFSGGHDHICGALACGILDQRFVLDSSGTAEEILAATPALSRVRELGQEGFNVGRYVTPDLYYTASGMPASGASMDWYARSFPLSSAQAAARTAGANGLLFLPHLRGSSSPTRNPDSRGAFLGIRQFHTPADFSQAVYEGLCFEFRQSFLRLTQGTSPEKIIAIGGSTKNAHWMQTKANITGFPIEIPAIQESTALGAALLAGIGAGVYASAADAVARTYRTGRTVCPDPSLRDEYDRLFAIYTRVYDALLPLHEAM